MISYYSPEKLEDFLRSLFVDDESTPEDIVVLESSVAFELSACCVYNYAGYNI